MSSAHYPLSELGRVYTLSAGPSGATPATLAALQKPVLYHSGGRAGLRRWAETAHAWS